MSPDRRIALSVVTPTYNRAQDLPGLYESLCRQTDQRFEWIVVDDGSQDETRAVLAELKAREALRMQVLHQPNRGKHVALNRGFARAVGRYGVVIDSDDLCTETFVGFLLDAWASHTPESLGAVSVCVEDLDGRRSSVVRVPTGQRCLIGKPYRFYEQKRMQGDVLHCFRMSVLRAFPFPEFPGERFLPEGIVWNRIAGKHDFALYPDRLVRVRYRPDGLSHQIDRLRMESPRGAHLFYLESALLSSSGEAHRRAVANEVRYALHAGMPQACGPSKFKADPVSVALGFALYLKDRLRYS